ncbi:MAG TPA: N-acetylmuramoyl-L-alanine amidase, partial [Symbiobacteriaceae bacterium]|nr:N-acetylmuramoyl-L-alanine amidase [Symbiobacteriaceae bacterium]
NLSISLKLKALLEQAGAKVVMTRTADTRCSTPAQLSGLTGAEQLRVDLNCRTVVPNTAGADLFLSVHSNASPATSARGVESYWSTENLNDPQSRFFATLVQNEMVKALGTPDRGVMDEMFYVVKFTDAPAVLAEVGYVTNPSDEALFKQDAVRQQTAQALLRAMQRFFAGQ